MSCVFVFLDIHESSGWICDLPRSSFTYIMEGNSFPSDNEPNRLARQGGRVNTSLQARQRI